MKTNLSTHTKKSRVKEMSQTEKEEAFNLAFDLLDNQKNTWKTKRLNIFTTQKDYGTVYKAIFQCNCHTNTVFNTIMNNKSLMVLEYTILGMVDEQTDIIRAITAPSPCNFVKSKEFAFLETK